MVDGYEIYDLSEENVVYSPFNSTICNFPNAFFAPRGSIPRNPKYKPEITTHTTQRKQNVPRAQNFI